MLIPIGKLARNKIVPPETLVPKTLPNPKPQVLLLFKHCIRRPAKPPCPSNPFFLPYLPFMPGGILVTRDCIPPEQCEELIATCESCSFCKDPNPAYTQATLDIELDRQPLVAEKVKELGIIAKLTMAVKAFHRAVTCFNDVFVVKYDADQQRELERHTDGGDVSFMLALSSRDAYEGGGTEFDGEQGPLHLEQGSCVVFPASTYHRGIPITSGKRYLLVAFCYTSAAATRVPGNISLDVVPLHGNRNSFDLFDSENFLPSSIKASVKAWPSLENHVSSPRRRPRTLIRRPLRPSSSPSSDSTPSASI